MEVEQTQGEGEGVLKSILYSEVFTGRWVRVAGAMYLSVGLMLWRKPT